MRMRYDPFNWYWKADDGRIFSSIRSAIVAADDATYQAWLAAGFAPTPWPRDTAGNQSTAALQEVLTPYGLFADLTAYANAKQWKIAVGGHSVTINGAAVFFATDETSFSLITGKAARLQLSGAPASVDWQTGPTTFVTIAAADFIAAAANVADWMQSTWDVLKQVLAAITAGTITTMAQVDSPPSPIPAWPANS